MWGVKVCAWEPFYFLGGRHFGMFLDDTILPWSYKIDENGANGCWYNKSATFFFSIIIDRYYYCYSLKVIWPDPNVRILI